METKKEILQFLYDNNLDEIINDTPNNYLKETPIQPKKAENKITINKVNSTNDALSFLAKKKTDSNMTKNNDMISIKEIVNQAQELANKSENLEQLKKAVENFDGCNLKKMATNTVFCDGNKDSKIMVIGEAPGNHEDLQGIPFCGESGQLLDSMFKAIKFTRKDNFYITNTIFWRPPGNRKPTEEELAICRPFVERHIQLFDPKLIILVGATAMNSILNISSSITSTRGKFIDFAPNYLTKPTKSFVIFHPSYLLRQSMKKKIAWQDMLTIEQFANNNFS